MKKKHDMKDMMPYASDYDTSDDLDDPDDIEELTKAVSNNTDIARAMIELFKDTIKKDAKRFDIDLRTRLYWKGVKGHSIIQFLQSIDIEETKRPGKSALTLAEGLDVLSVSLKRHSVSFEGKSRHEIVELFKSELANKQLSGGIGQLFMPRG